MPHWPVLSRAQPGKLVGIITRGDVLRAHRKRLDESQRPARTLALRSLIPHRMPRAQALAQEN